MKHEMKLKICDLSIKGHLKKRLGGCLNHSMEMNGI